jgi:hypothetical protein
MGAQQCEWGALMARQPFSAAGAANVFNYKTLSDAARELRLHVSAVSARAQFPQLSRIWRSRVAFFLAFSVLRYMPSSPVGKLHWIFAARFDARLRPPVSMTATS